MGYVGSAPIISDYRKLDDISSQFNGSDTDFTLQVSSISVLPGQETRLIISVGGLIQEPVTAYTVSGSTISFTSAPVSGADFFGVLLGDNSNPIGIPSDSTITGAKLASSFVTGLAASTTVEDSDLILIDDGAGGTFRKMTRADFLESAALDSINITGGTITGITDLAVADGGTGASTFTDAGVLIGNGTGAVQSTSAGTSGQVLTSNGTGVDPTFQDANAIDVQTFTSSGTWTKPGGANMVLVEVIGGGGGGASGRKGAAASNRYAGGGGGSSAVTYFTFAASDLSSTETVTIGAGGTGGASVTTDNTGGINGTDGGTSIFGSTALATCVGGKGNYSSYYVAKIGSGALASSHFYQWGHLGGSGGQGSYTTGNTGASGIKTGGGGGGGGINTSDTSHAGGTGGAPNANFTSFSMTGVTALAGVSGGTAGGGAGSDATAGSGGGGGGGGSSSTGDAGDGGNGDTGGGGGGGGASQDSVGNSGAGGNGGDGRVRVWTW